LRLKLIACEILFREFCAAAARSVNRVDVEFLPKRLHDLGQAGMFARLKGVVEEVDQSQYDAVLLGYALCSNGIVGLAAGDIPLVVPRAHDCISLFLGSKEQYLEYFQSHPGVYFKTSGWIERGEGPEQFTGDSVQKRNSMNQTYEELAAKYGEDNARFLYEQLSEMTHNYGRLTYIEMGIEPDDRFERYAREEAAELGWDYERLTGDMSLIQDLLDAHWDDERFLVVQPGSQVSASFDERIIKAAKNRQ